MAKWFYLVDGRQSGAVEPADLKRLADSGKLKPHDKVRREDITEWYFANDVTGLFAAHAQTGRRLVAKPVQAAPFNSVHKLESPKVGPSTAELFTRPWRRYKNRWARAAVFVACCAIAIPVSKWAGRFFATQLIEVKPTSQTASTPHNDLTPFIPANEPHPSAIPQGAGTANDQELFAKGETLVFDTTGHKNANGIRMRLSYPRTWKVEDGDGPATVQRLIGDGGQGNQAVLIQTWVLPKPFDRELTADEKKAYLGKDVAKQAFGREVDLKFHTITQLNGEPCAMLEIERILEQGSLKIGMKALVFIIVRDGVQLMLTCYVQGDASRGVSIIWQEYDATKPLFMEIVESCVFMGKRRASLGLRP